MWSVEGEEKRWSALDERLLAVERDIASLSANFSAFLREQNDTQATLKELVSTVQHRSQTNWGAFFSAATVLLALIAVYSQLVQGNMEDTHGFLDTKVASNFERVGSRIDRLDVNLQREMRDLDSATQVQIDSLDEMLQREMRLLRDTDRVEIQRSTQEIQRLRDRVDAMAANRWSSADHRAFTDELNERLRAMEARLEALIDRATDP